MTNISSLEIAELRPFFQKALQHLQVIQGEIPVLLVER